MSLMLLPDTDCLGSTEGEVGITPKDAPPPPPPPPNEEPEDPPLPEDPDPPPKVAGGKLTGDAGEGEDGKVVAGGVEGVEVAVGG